MALGVLQLTWFFSTLYLLTLYVTLFLRPLRGPSSELMASPSRPRSGALARCAAAVWICTENDNYLVQPRELASSF